VRSVFLILVTLALPRLAQASAFYYEIEGGLAKYSTTAPFFGSSAQSTGYGFALNNGAFLTLGSSQTGFTYQLGLQDRISAANDSSSGTSYALNIAYPVLRLQFSRIFIAAGYSPFVWQEVQPSTTLNYFARAKSADALLLEAGLLWPITRKFSMGANLGYQSITQNGVKGPSPALDATISMRFYFGFMTGKGGSENSAEFEGWRYPFGAPR
jgi:hypothetical protein